MSPSTQFQAVACNICGSHETRLVFRKWKFNIVQCVACELVYVNPRSFRIEEDDYFKGAYLSTIEKDGKLETCIASLYSEILYNIGNRVPLGRLLDVGCAMGHFLAFAKRYGWQVEGVECSPYAARYAEEHFDVKVHPVCVLSDARLPKDSYNSCVLVEVIEHLADPRETLTEIWRLLEPGGVVYLTTPNFSCYRSMLLREEWDVIIPVGHLYYFDGASLGNLLSSVGFIDVENLTGALDFASELELVEKSGLSKLTLEELAKVRQVARADAEKGPDNRRDLALVMCARKPWKSAHQQSDYSQRIPRQPFKMAFAGCLVRRPGETPEDLKVYFVENGRKRWVTTADWIIAKGMRWPEDVQFVTAQELDAILTGPPLP
jgi:2-polyprenyl-3-methyl-5-hydroxy-6-metoxy-1,4-benzoquinol methylase